MARNVGLIVVGLMGYGLARNILKHEHALTFMAHPGDRPLDAHFAAGARTRATAAEIDLQFASVIATFQCAFCNAVANA